MQGNWVISGSDDGSVRIFDQRSGELLKSLRHSDGMRQFVSSLFYTYCLAVEALVQVVAVSESYTTYRQTTHPSPPSRIQKVSIAWLSVVPQAQASRISKFGRISRLVIHLVI